MRMGFRLARHQIDTSKAVAMFFDSTDLKLYGAVAINLLIKKTGTVCHCSTAPRPSCAAAAAGWLFMYRTARGRATRQDRGRRQYLYLL